jgi:hypothetical protein
MKRRIGASSLDGANDVGAAAGWLHSDVREQHLVQPVRAITVVPSRMPARARSRSCDSTTKWQSRRSGMFQ